MSLLNAVIIQPFSSKIRVWINHCTHLEVGVCKGRRRPCKTWEVTAAEDLHSQNNDETRKHMQQKSSKSGLNWINKWLVKIKFVGGELQMKKVKSEINAGLCAAQESHLLK